MVLCNAILESGLSVFFFTMLKSIGVMSVERNTSLSELSVEQMTLARSVGIAKTLPSEQVVSLNMATSGLRDMFAKTRHSRFRHQFQPIINSPHNSCLNPTSTIALRPAVSVDRHHDKSGHVCLVIN